MTKDPYRYFRVEARELLEQLGRGCLALEQAGGGSADDVARLLRFAHTLKGAARVVRQPRIAEHTHAIEDELAPFRDGGAVPRAPLDAVLAHLDQIGALLAALDAPPAPAPAPMPTAPALPIEVVRSASAGELDSLLDGLAETHVQLDAVRRAVAAAERAGLDRALVRELSRATEQLGRELSQSRDTAEQLRLVAAGALFTALERTARDCARGLGRRAHVLTSGGELRLEARVLDGVLPALVQAVRNAVAHGIETEGERAAAGKPLDGTITIGIVRRGARAAFLVHDDGRGVDLAAVRRAAIARGATPDEIAALDDEQVLARLWRGGISTAATITDLAGRGVGLDVIREAAERLGGTVRLATAAGRGTTVEMEVPISLAAVESLVVEAGTVAATIPLEAVRRTLRIAPGELSAADRGLAVVVDGEVVPFVPLPRALRQPAAAGGRAWPAVLVDSPAGRAAIGVDRLLGTARVVLRPLPALAPADPVVAGASLDEEGAPRLALDPAGLVAAAQRHTVVAEPAPPPRRPVLVIDDSLTTRMLEQSILESAGWPVELATSGEEALAKAGASEYALFLVDVEMPGIDGFTFIERVRADPALRHVPAVLVTSRDSADDRRRGREAGAQGHVVKSEFDQAALIALIERLVGS